MNIILGTASKYRKSIFEGMGYGDFEVMSADIDEKAIRLNDPERLTLALAGAKADALSERIKKPALLITADQVVSWNGEIREKPESEEQAREYLESYHKAPAVVVNGIVVTNTATGHRVSGVDTSTIVFRQIPREVVDILVQDPEIYNHAGGFAIANATIEPYLERVEGAIDSIQGLPKALTRELLERAKTGGLSPEPPRAS